MTVRNLLATTAISVLLANPAGAQEALVTYKSLSPELALDLARATLADCRKRGFQVSVAVVDRTSNPVWVRRTTVASNVPPPRS